MTKLIGQSLGRYHILEQLGEGGMATVYKAYDTRLERDVAVKVIRTESLPQNAVARALKRFEREAKALGKLTHPNIVPVSDYGEFEGKPYLVMPYLPGGTLKQKLGKPIPWQEAVQLLSPIVEALDYAHSQDLIHRDVKPSNILLTERGQPMLTDFGIARVLDAEETMDLTGTSAAVGTPEYMAPEQATAKTADQRADIYALGIVLYETVTGRKPYQADTPMAVMIMHARDPLPRPSQYVRDLPDSIEKFLLKALAKKPEDRYQSMVEMGAALGKLTDATHISGPPTVKSELPKQTKKIATEPSAKGLRGIPKWVWWTIAGFAGVGLVSGVFKLAKSSLPTQPILVPTLITTNIHMPNHSNEASLSPLPSFTPGSINTATPSPSLTESPVPTTSSLPSAITDDFGVEMVLVPEGEFVMGSDIVDHANIDAKPAHTVYLDAYYIDKYEVTNANYKACEEAGACQAPQDVDSWNRSNYYNRTEFENYPVVNTNWFMAKDYCNWRDAQLPTEAQWEKAARGTDARRYPWGEEKKDCSKANTKVEIASQDEPKYCAARDTVQVGSYENGKSPYGLYDMAGNVQEWVTDWYLESYYQISPLSNPLGPETGQKRVIRGGSPGQPVESYIRRFGDPKSISIYKDLGFRCARDATP